MLKELIKKSQVDIDMALFEAELDRQVLKYMQSRQADRIGMHASELISDKFCPRRICYYEFGIVKRSEDSLSSKTLRIFLHGIATHLKYQFIFKKAGLALAVEQRFYNKFLNITATPDVIIKFMGKKYVVEIKSVNTYAFTSMKKPPKAAVAQANLYMYITSIPQAIVLCENKNTQEIKLFKIEFDLDDVRQYIERRLYVNECIAQRKLPKRLCGSVTDAKHCSCKEICFRTGVLR